MYLPTIATVLAGLSAAVPDARAAPPVQRLPPGPIEYDAGGMPYNALMPSGNEDTEHRAELIPRDIFGAPSDESQGEWWQQYTSGGELAPTVSSPLTPLAPNGTNHTGSPTMLIWPWGPIIVNPGTPSGNGSNGPEAPEEGEAKQKCVKWADYGQFSGYLDNAPRRPPFLRGSERQNWEKLKEEVKLEHLDCVEDIANVALERMKGGGSEVFDDQTERIVDGLQGEGESSTAYKEFKAFLENPGEAVNAKYGWKIQDPKLRAKLREDAVEELGLLNHKLRTGEWVLETPEGKPFSIMDAMMRMDELKEGIKLMDRISEYDTLPPPVRA